MADRGVLGTVFTTALLLLGVGVFSPASAQACAADEAAVFGVSSGCVDAQFSAPPTAVDAAPAFTQAGGHPHDVSLAFHLNGPSDPGDPAHGRFWPPEALKDLSFALPTGFAASQSAVPRCTLLELSQIEMGGEMTAPACPPASQVGVMATTVVAHLFSVELQTLDGIPLYALPSGPDGGVSFGFPLLGAAVLLSGKIGPAPEYRMTLEMHNVSQAIPLIGGATTLWGVPADPRHTPERSCPGQLIAANPFAPSCAAGVPPQAFLRLPTACGELPATIVSADSWESPGNRVTVVVDNHLPPGLLGDPTDLAQYPAERPGLAASAWGPPQGFTGCGYLPFDPALSVSGTSSDAGAPTGPDISIAFPQRGLADPRGLSESDLKSIGIELPAGMSINPSMASGLRSCSEAEVGLENQAPPRCPDASKLGSVELRTPLLEDALSGSIYLATPPEGTISSVPVYVTAEAQGAFVKLAGELRPAGDGPGLEAVIEGVPQVPVALLRLRFFGGERAPFLNPKQCGKASFSGNFEPWSGSSPATANATSTVDSGPDGGPCPAVERRPFAPKLSGGSSNPVAGRPTPFSLAVERPFGDQQLESFSAVLPAGVSARLGRIERCDDASISAAEAEGRAGRDELDAPSCPGSSRVGTLRMAVGAGERPLSLEGGRVYLAGPYRGGLASLAAIVPALAGPLDFGAVVLRMPLSLDGQDGRMRITAGLPEESRGLRLEPRAISLTIDRPGFLSNPTSCAQMGIEATFSGDEGGRASASAPFRLRRCRSLPFRPLLRTRVVGGARATRHGSNPGVAVGLAMRGRGANPRRMALVMPASEQLDPAHLANVCTKRQFESARGCPHSTVYGSADLRTTMFDQRLRGPVYMRSSNHRFPNLVAKLSGPGSVRLELNGRMTFAHGRVKVVFDEIPDLPLARFALRLKGGRRGVLVNNRDLCRGRPHVVASIRAHSGAARRLVVPLARSCG